MALISLIEYAKMHGKDRSNVAKLAADGRFKTAKKIGAIWTIESDEPYPGDSREKEIASSMIDDAVALYHKIGSIKSAAKEMGVSFNKFRKLLITAGAVQPEITQKIKFYETQGLDIHQISEKLKMQPKTLSNYMPYTRTVYNQPTRSQNAERISAWRKNKD